MPWAIVAACVSAGWFLAMIGFRLASPRPTMLGVRDGRLAPCPSTPNCVCSCATDPDHLMPPLPFNGVPTAALERLRTVLADLPRMTIVSREEGYLHAEFRSRLFRFVDDVEFLIDGATKVIHFRSASRVGRSDLGANRRRMEAIRRAYLSTIEDVSRARGA